MQWFTPQGQNCSFLVLVLFGWPYDLPQHRHYHHQLISIFGRKNSPSKLRAQRWAACLAWRSMPKVWAKVNWNHTNYHPHMVLVIEQLGWITKYPDKTWDIFWVWWWIDLAIYMGKGLYECKLMNFNLEVKLGSTQVWEGKEI